MSHLASSSERDPSLAPCHPQRQKRLLNRVRQRPEIVLKDRRCLKPDFCQAFFDHCIDMALQSAENAVELAALAIELARRTGDHHLIHRAEGVRVHAYIATSDRARAAELLDDYRLSALTCCRPCVSDWYARQGDLLVESHEVADADVALRRSLDALGATGDALARLCFVRAIEHHYEGARELALSDVETVLRELALTSPRGYFLDSLAFISCFLEGGCDRRHDEQAMVIVTAFKERLVGLEDWTDARLRLAWVEGQLSARLGDFRRADERLERTWKSLVRPGPDRHALAAAVDHCRLYSFRPNDASRHRILSTLGACQRRLGKLEPVLRRALDETKRIVSKHPRAIPAVLWALRRSFIVPVPGIVAKPRTSERPISASKIGQVYR